MINAPVLHVNGDYPEGKSSFSRIVYFKDNRRCCACHGYRIPV